MFFASITKRTIPFAAQTSGVRIFPRGLQTINATHGTPAAHVTYPEARWRPVRTLTAFRRDISSSTDAHIPMPVASGVVSQVIVPTAGLVDVFASTPEVVLARVITPTAGLVDVAAPAVDVSIAQEINPTAGLVDVSAPTPSVVLTRVVTPTAGLVDVSAPTPGITTYPIIYPSPGLVDVTAPTVVVAQGALEVRLLPASFAVLAPPVRVMYGRPGQLLSDLEDPERSQSLASPNVVVQTTYEVTVGGTQGLDAVALPAISIDITKRRYEISTPVFAWSPNGKIPIPQDTGVYLSHDSGGHWEYLGLPNFPESTNFGQPRLITRDGKSYLFFTSREGRIARYAIATRKTIIAKFEGLKSDLDLQRDSFALAVEPGASNVLLFAAGRLSGIWRSADNGETFTLSNKGQGITYAHAAVAFHPTVPGLCYAGDNNIGSPSAVYRSTDSGQTWVVAGILDLEETGLYTIALGSDPDIVYARTATSVLKSTDQGATFAPVHTGLPDGHVTINDYMVGFTPGNQIVVCPGDSSVLYLGLDIGPLGAIYKSTDAGGSWTEVYSAIQGVGPLQGRPTAGLAVHPVDPDQVAFTSRGQFGLSGLHFSTDGGSSWTLIGFPQAVVGVPLGGADPVVMLGVEYGVTTRMAATGRHLTDGNGMMVSLGIDTVYGEIHEAEITLPYSPAFVTSINQRTDTSGPTPIFPLLRFNTVRQYRRGSVQKIRLAEIRLERLEVNQSSKNRLIKLFGKTTYPDTGRGPQPIRALPLRTVENIEDAGTEVSVTLPGIHTEWQTYDQMIVNGRTVRISALRYSITTSRRSTILGTAITDSAALDSNAESANAHPRVRQGSVPTR